MLRRGDVKGSNRREGAEADTAENSGMMAVVSDVLESLPCLGPVDTQACPFEPSRSQKGWTGSR
jgi:hypothetical protein